MKHIELAVSNYKELKEEIKKLEEELSFYKNEIENYLLTVPEFKDEKIGCSMVECTRESVNVKKLKEELGENAYKFVKTTHYSMLKVVR